MDAYTSAMASMSACRRSRLEPWLARKRLRYFPLKADPTRSSRRLELRTMRGVVPASSNTEESPFTISGGKAALRKTWMT